MADTINENNNSVNTSEEIKLKDKPLVPVEGQTKEQLQENTRLAKELLTAATISLLQQGQQHYYGQLLLQFRTYYTTGLDTLGVSVTDGINLYINPNMAAAYYRYDDNPIEAYKNFIIHECNHVLLNHFDRGDIIAPATAAYKERMANKKPTSKEYENAYDDNGKLKEDFVENKAKEILEDMAAKQLLRDLNISGDMAMHEFMPNMRKKFITADPITGDVARHPETIEINGIEMPNPLAGQIKLNDGCFVDTLIADWEKLRAKNPKLPICEKNQNMEYYFYFLQKGREESEAQGNCSGFGEGMHTLDDHDIWGESIPNKEYVKEKIRQAANEAKARCAGNIPGDVQAMIEALNHSPRNWRKDLRNFPARCAEASQTTSRSKLHRRYGRTFGPIFPGMRTDEDVHIVAAWDSSGSMWGDGALEQIATELNKMVKEGIKVTVVEFDADIQNVSQLEKTLKSMELKGGGGTAFAPVFEYVNNVTEFEGSTLAAKYGNVDGLIMFTDGGAFDYGAFHEPKYPVLWALNEGCQVDVDWGQKTTIEVRKEKP